MQGIEEPPAASRSPGNLKDAIRAYWSVQPPGPESARSPEGTRAFTAEIEEQRYSFYADLFRHVDFDRSGRDVLEVGVGAGTDTVRFARSGARMTGIDISPRQLDLTRKALDCEGLDGKLFRGDAESLPFPDESFDLYYSCGVLMCFPDTAAALREAYRVLRPGGEAVVILYNRDSMNYWHMVYRYGILGGELGHRTPDEIVARYAEYRTDCPHLHGYTADEGVALLRKIGFLGVRATPCHPVLCRFPERSTSELPAVSEIDGLAHPGTREFFRRAAAWEREGRLAEQGGWFLVVRGRKPERAPVAPPTLPLPTWADLDRLPVGEGSLTEEYLFWMGLASLLKPKRILEIGTSRGVSSLMLLWGASLFDPGARLTTVDLRRDPEADRNWARHPGLRDRIEPVLADSLHVLPALAEKRARFDLIFLDGSHDYETVRREWELAREMTDTWILHDTHQCDGPRRVVEEIRGDARFDVLSLRYPHGHQVHDHQEGVHYRGLYHQRQLPWTNTVEGPGMTLVRRRKVS